MKITILTLAASMMITGPAPAFASDAGSCYTIGDMDARNYCLAKARKDVGMCYTIINGNLRQFCLAEVRK